MSHRLHIISSAPAVKRGQSQISRYCKAISSYMKPISAIGAQHIAVIGASGKVGRVALQHLMLSNCNPHMRVSLISRHLNKAEGLLCDIKSALPMVRSAYPRSLIEPRIQAIDSFAEIKGADLIVVTASITAPRSVKEAFRRRDPTGRLVHSVPIRFSPTPPTCGVSPIS